MAETLLLVEDDVDFSRTLKRSLERRGYRVLTAHSLQEVETVLAGEQPSRAVVDLKLGNDSGLACVARLRERDPAMLIVVLTGYASIATAVEAIKLGASHYLAKPSNTDDIIEAFNRVGGNVDTPVSEQTTSIKTLEWEHIHKVLAETDFNISEAARRLGMHRRTLARKLDKKYIR